MVAFAAFSTILYLQILQMKKKQYLLCYTDCEPNCVSKADHRESVTLYVLGNLISQGILLYLLR